VTPDGLAPAFQRSSKEGTSGWIEEVYKRIGLSPKELNDFVRWGYVRTRKRGSNRQGRRTFLTEDILAAIYDEANGRRPRKRRKTP
jgi:hypothetical protein